MNKADRKWFEDHGYIAAKKKVTTWKLVYNNMEEVARGAYSLCVYKRKECRSKSQYSNHLFKIVPA